MANTAKNQNVIITGATGAGKTYLACALADQACRKGIDAAYRRMPRLMQEMHVARHDGSYSKLLSRFAKMHLLIIDDWGITPLGDQERRDLLEVLEDRHGAKSTIIATQLPVDAWHPYIGDATVAGAILDRVVHNAHKLDLKGTSMRKVKTTLTSQEASASIEQNWQRRFAPIQIPKPSCTIGFGRNRRSTSTECAATLWPVKSLDSGPCFCAR